MPAWAYVNLMVPEKFVTLVFDALTTDQLTNRDGVQSFGCACLKLLIRIAVWDSGAQRCPESWTCGRSFGVLRTRELNLSMNNLTKRIPKQRFQPPLGEQYHCDISSPNLLYNKVSKLSTATTKPEQAAYPSLSTITHDKISFRISVYAAKLISLVFACIRLTIITTLSNFSLPHSVFLLPK
jgi:hypothetical protein